MPKQSRFYLDTSVLFERQGGSSATRRQIKELLKGSLHATSTQVEREWNRIVYTSAVAMRKALVSSRDWTDVIKGMSTGYGRTGARQLQVLHWITGSTETDFKVVEKRLDDYQRVRFRAMFKAGIETVRDGTNCDVARRRPHRLRSQWKYLSECRKTDDICDQPSFLEKHRERAMLAAQALEKSGRKGDRIMGKRAVEALEAARSEPAATKGKQCHAANGLGGDITVALECAQGEILLTTDRSFDLICPAIGIDHQRI